jgi:hypothetical protein
MARSHTFGLVRRMLSGIGCLAFLLAAGVYAQGAEARAKRVENRSELCQGPMATGALGDYVLDNGKMRVVVADTATTDLPGMRGAVVDVGFAPLHLDYLKSFVPRYNGATLFNLQVDSIKVVKPAELPKGYAAIDVHGRDKDLKWLDVVTRYEMAPDSTDLHVITTLTNETASASVNFIPGDMMYWGPSLSVFVPLMGSLTRTTKSSTPWLVGRAADCSIGVVLPKGQIDATHYYTSEKQESTLVYREPMPVPAKGSLKWDRYLCVSDRDFGKISDFAVQVRKEPLATFEGRLYDQGTSGPVAKCPMWIIRKALKEPGLGKHYTLTQSDAQGRYKVTLPVGNYYPWPLPEDRLLTGASYTTDLTTAGVHIFRDIVMSHTTYLAYSIVDGATKKPIPAKLTFVPIPPTQPVYFGIGDGVAAGSAVCVPPRPGKIAVRPGKYEIVISRGIEYNAIKETVDIGDEAPAGVTVQLDRVVDTAGYISVDIGAMTKASYDGMLSPADRLLTAAAEGVELVISGDDGAATDLSQAPNAKDLQPWVATMPGKRIRMGNVGRPGEFVVFPVDPKLDNASLTKQEYAAKDSLELTALLRKHYPTALIQLCKPLDPAEGLFSTAGYDVNIARKDRKLPTNISYDFDLFEFMAGKEQKNWGMPYGLLQDLVLAGKRYAIAGSSDSRMSYGEEIGYPRTYVQSSTDDPAKIDKDEIVRNLKAGKVLITNGPFVRFKIEKKGYGEMATARDRRIECELTCQHAPWVGVSSIELDRNAELLWRVDVTPTTGVVAFPDPNGKNSSYFETFAYRDTACNIVARGKNPLTPIVAPVPDATDKGAAPAEVMPMCITGTIYVDADADGKYNPSREFNP